MPEASQGRRVWDLSDEMIKERRWSFELALRRELDETATYRSASGTETRQPEMTTSNKFHELFPCCKLTEYHSVSTL